MGLSAVSIIAAVVAFSLIFQFFYKRKIRKEAQSSHQSESFKRQFGQVTGLSDAKTGQAKHGLVLDVETGVYYSQHRHANHLLHKDI